MADPIIARRRTKAEEKGWQRRSRGLFKRLVAQDGPTCYLCRSAPATLVEHVWPVRLGGTDHPYNLRVACRPCNSKKRCTPPGVLPLFVVGDPWREWERYRIEQRMGGLVSGLARRHRYGEAMDLARGIVLAELEAAGFDGFFT
jgi:hypothetical protein